MLMPPLSLCGAFVHVIRGSLPAPQEWGAPPSAGGGQSAKRLRPYKEHGAHTFTGNPTFPVALPRVDSGED